jgi:glycosyltransferase involved in cell wall biosynthesis
MISEELQQHILCVAKSLGLEADSQRIRLWNTDPDNPERRSIERVAGKIFPNQPRVQRWTDWHLEGFDPTHKSQGPSQAVGIVHTVFHSCGGTETWAKHFVRVLGQRVPIAGLAYLAGDRSRGSIEGADGPVPIACGIRAAEGLSSVCDTLILWGLSGQIVEQLRKSARRDCRLIHVHHGDPNSHWSTGIVQEAKAPEDLLVCVHPQVARLIGGLWIPNAIDPCRITTQRNVKAPTVLFMHRFSEEKKPLLAVDACRLLPAEWKMVFAGRGEFFDQAIQRAQGDMRFTFVADGDPLALFPQASVFLSLSTTEGFGYSIAEAAASGLRVVSRPVGIAIDPQVAMQIPWGVSTPQEISMLIQKAGQETSKAAASREFVLQEFSEQIFAKKWLGVL